MFSFWDTCHLCHTRFYKIPLLGLEVFSMVEKRKHPLLALFFNQLLYAVISFVIVTSMTGTWQQFFGCFFFILYLSGIYSYARRAGTDHQKSYSQIKPNIKFPTAYALIALGYFVIPLGIAYLANHWIVQLVTIFWEAPFYFGNVILASGEIRLIPIAIFGGLMILVTYLGYLAGVKQFCFTPLLTKLLYRPADNQNDKTNK